MVRLEVVEHSTQHADVVSCATWSPAYELYTCADDNKILRWSMDGEILGEASMSDAFVTCISWCPSVGKGAADVFAVGCGSRRRGVGQPLDPRVPASGGTDGTFRLMAGAKCREEKKVAAHHGACLDIVWNAEGSALYTCGEDGDLKVWSKSGNLRSTPVKSGRPIYAMATGPGGDAVVYVCERKLHVEAVGDLKRAPLSWVAHEATVLCVSWNAVHGRICSGGEDCRYKVWDHFGRQLFQSQPFAHVITSVCWSPNGDFFAVGAFDLLRLCDKTGWSCARSQPRSGSILHVAWTGDGTQLVGCGGNGTACFAQLVDRKYECDHLEATLVSQRTINVHDCVAETYESLDFNRDRVVEMALGFNHLVVSTTTQCFIYGTSNWNTPFIFDSPDTISLIVLAAKHFLVVSPQGVTIYAYDGRKLSSPKFPGLRPEAMSSSAISLSSDVVAIIDASDRKVVRCFDVATGRPITGSAAVLQHKAEMTMVALNQRNASMRQCVVIDRNSELHIFQVTGGDRGHETNVNGTLVNAHAFKLHTQVDTACWNDGSEMLCAVADGRLIVWYYPQIVSTDRDLLPLTMSIKDAAEFGKMSTIVSFSQSRIAVRRADGALITVAVQPYAALLYDFASAQRWDEATRLCRFVDDSACWAMLAAMAVDGTNLDVAELALAALGHVDKVEYMLHIKSLPSNEARAAELALYTRRPDAAEKIFLQAQPPLLYRAIKLNVRLFRWERALELAVKHRSHVDTVLAYRSKHLEACGKKETDDRFKQLAATVQWDWATIKAKKEVEKREECERHGKKYVKKAGPAAAPRDDDRGDGNGDHK
ncbi:WD40-repeat-containing domain protein [Pelagophyceae sp. CCMP2097]|nr:WD40-repeat-containing domain protein [Pelagophyceae sp. CCMP2097]